MGSISSLGNFFQLSSLLSSGSGSSLSSSTASSSTNETLAQMLDAADSTSSQNGSSSYLLDLSPEAQQLMGGSSASGSASGSSNFVLSQAQETTIQNILEKYKNAPFDQATFNSIQSDLQAAGLSPETLGAENQVQSFNPTNVLIGALDGNYAPIQTPGTSASNEQTKETSYLKNIISAWQSDIAASSGSGSAAVSSGSGTSIIA